MAHILIVDDEKNLRRSLCIALEEWGHQAEDAESGEDAIKRIEEEVFDILITDLVMDEIDGIALLKRARELSPSTEVILMSAHGTISKAVEALRLGATDFIVKPFAMDHFEGVLKKTLDQKELKKTVKHLRAVLADHYPLEDIVSESPEMRQIMQQVSRVADWSLPVLIQGESGVGKELIALALHRLSSRKNNSFLPVNCGAFPETLLDSELFGHCRGAFTGAAMTKRGLIEEADGGTLLLDEIGEAPQALQVRLLRFLDNGRFRRIGETVERECDVRIIAATNQDLAKEIEEGRFREDLFYRLSVAIVNIPPLRERKEDITALSQRFLKIYSEKTGKPVKRFHPSVLSLFHSYAWPGNVRELENSIEHAIVIAQDEEIGVEDLPPKFKQSELKSKEFVFEGNPTLNEVEKRYIFSILEKTEGNKKRAAEILNISRTTLISRLKTYNNVEAIPN